MAEAPRTSFLPPWDRRRNVSRRDVEFASRPLSPTTTNNRDKGAHKEVFSGPQPFVSRASRADAYVSRSASPGRNVDGAPPGLVFQSREDPYPGNGNAEQFLDPGSAIVSGRGKPAIPIDPDVTELYRVISEQAENIVELEERVRSLRLEHGDRDPEDVVGSEQPFEEGSPDSFSLPETVYSSAIILPLAIDPDHTPVRRRAILFALCTSWVLLFVNNFVQCTLIYFMDDVNQARKDRDCLELRLLCVVGLVLFVSQGTTEVLQTIDMMQWLYYVPTETKPRELTLNVHQGGDKSWSSGMSHFFKVLCTLVILLPKLAIAFLLNIFGSEYILKSRDAEEILLVMVAMSFIVGVDEVLYEAFTPPDIKQVIADLPPVAFPYSEQRMLWTVVVRPITAGVITTVIVVTSLHVFCSFY